MPPKQPKLTKKQLEEQRKEQLRLQKLKEEEEAAAERARLEEEAKIKQIARQERLEQERIRIAEEGESQRPRFEERIRAEEQAFNELLRKEHWKNFTTEYHKDSGINGTKLSTFINIFKSSEYKNPQIALKECQECEVYLRNLSEKMYENRAEYKMKEAEQCQKYIQMLQAQQMKKLQKVMIQYANSAEELEDKNLEEAKKKNEQSATQKNIKPIDNLHEGTQHFKIGMYINTLSTKNYNKFNPIGIKQFGFNTEVPSKWINNTSIVKFQWVGFDPFSANSKEQFRIVGGVFNIEFYEMFIGTKKTNNITIRRSYKDKEILDRFKLPTSAIKEPFKLMYEIPSYVFLVPYTKATLKLAQYDMAASKWTILPNDSISEYLEQEKRVICRVSRPEPIALVENKCADYPYVAWELRTIDKGRVLLDLELQRYLPTLKEEEEEPTHLMLQFDIGPNRMKLVMNEQYSEFMDLCEEFHTPEHVLRELSYRGIHLLPSDNDYEFAGVTLKGRESEKCAIRDLAYACESFTVRSEPNESDEIRVKIRQNLDHENIFLEDQEKDWLRAKWQDGGKCSITNRGVEERHLNLETVLAEHNLCEVQCIERMKYDKDFLLRKTIMKVLELTRLLAFTTGDAKQRTTLVQTLKKKIIVSQE